MNKNQVKISSILLNSPPFSRISFMPTNINFIFGKNGSGKSTIARAIRDNTGLTTIPDSSSSTTVQVFNDEYIKKNIAGSLEGVFTISEADIETEKRIQFVNEEIGKESQQQDTLRKQHVRALSEKSDLTSTIYDSCWALTRSFIKKLKHNPTNAAKKADFYKQISSASPIEHDLDEILKTEELAYNSGAVVVARLKEIIVSTPDFSLLETPIVALKETQFSKFMKEMGNDALDWVYKGHTLFEAKAKGRCPYCQQDLTPDIVQNIESAFDETYTKALAELNTLNERIFPDYKSEITRTIETIKSSTGYCFVDGSKFDALCSKLDTLFEQAISGLTMKLATPSSNISVPDFSAIIIQINQLIQEANKKIAEHNSLIESGNKKALFEKIVREHCAFLCEDAIDTYKNAFKKKAEAIKEIEDQLKVSETKSDEFRAELIELHKKTTSTLPVIDKINNLLVASGFNSFSIAPSGERNYKLIRPDCSEATFLSEGEKNFICFLYFYYSVFGVLNEEIGFDDRIVVIDDPVSSMDSDAVFIIAELVREIIEAALNAFNPIKEDGVATHIKQVFILTHNSFFYNEVAPMYLTCYETVSYFEIIKDGTSSNIIPNIKKTNPGAINEKEINYIPELGNYASLWEIYRTTNNPRILMNTMRRILEEYFLHNLGYTAGSLKKQLLTVNKTKFTEPVDYTLARALVNYVSNDAISSINFSTYTSDLDKLKSIFYKLFDILNQTQHYEMMMNR